MVARSVRASTWCQGHFRTGVPCFILDAKVAVPGAVEPEVFLRVFEEHGIGAVTAGAG